MNKINRLNYKSPWGELVLGSIGEDLCLCDWRDRKARTSVDNRLKRILEANFVESESDIIVKAIYQLEEYFQSKRQHFDIPLLLAGTDFQKKVWKQLQKIPFGKTCSYAQLSEALGDKKAIRAVANANGANAISIFIPCHRVIGSSGELTGYAGGLEAKAGLLKLEQA